MPVVASWPRQHGRDLDFKRSGHGQLGRILQVEKSAAYPKGTQVTGFWLFLLRQ